MRHFVGVEKVELRQIVFLVAVLLHGLVGSDAVVGLGHRAVGIERLGEEGILHGGHEHRAVVVLVGVFGCQLVGDVPERHIGSLAARDGTGRIEVAVLQLVRHAVVIAIAESIFQSKLTFAFVVTTQ